MELQTLYRRSSTGATLSWRIWTEGSEYVIESGQIDGAKVISRRQCEAKNVGRSNGTTPERQAELEAMSEWQHKVDRKYVQRIEDVHKRKIEVMLAPNDKFIDTLNPKKSTRKYAKYPADVQPKLDGARCLAYWDGDRIVLMTRGRKEWNLPHIKAQLEKCLPKEAFFDGELYYHGVKRQTIQKWITKHYPESKKIEFHVYDIPVDENGEEKLWEERRLDLDRLVPGQPMQADSNTPNIVKVLTLEVQSEEQVMAFEAACIEQQFEGVMVRNRKGVYEWGVRSKNLLKVKRFEDDEFKVVDFTEAEGGHKGCVIWICETKDGKRFKVVPNGSLDERAEWFRTADQYMGKLLTVKFQGYSNDGLPQIAKGIAFRLPEDMS